MDTKIGFRTYLPEDVANLKPRQDLLQKLRKLDPTSPTPEEEKTGISKLRYMQHRELMSTSHSHGFRIEAVKHGNRAAKTLKGGEITSLETVMHEMSDFLEGDVDIRDKYLARLAELRDTLVHSPFFRHHEVVGSSLLLLHGSCGNVGVWMIDFGKTVPHPDRELMHDSFTKDHLTSREEGYIMGLDNLMAVFRDCLPVSALEPTAPHS
jgi:1D-myo-inositol-triphosphate 3-kinase